MDGDVKVSRRQEDGKAEATSVGGWRERRQGKAGQGRAGQGRRAQASKPPDPVLIMTKLGEPLQNTLNQATENC